ncbi:Transcription factor GRAS [Corchorus olitorius]|uniref:Transcription factor GRAS n=1 Tax=Corchorus olitorius TaxID=93759 RepID=A0A1R3J8M7_9ROSI|nr:Transcription factor GRAS [Corchorus olitorius]
MDPFNPSNISVDPPAKPNHPPDYYHLDSSSSGSNSDGDHSPYGSENLDFSLAVIKFINDTLMEEDEEGRPCMFQDCLALQAAEKSFYDVLMQNYADGNNLVESSWNYDDQLGFDSSLKQISNSSIARKNHPRDSSEERRNNKQFAAVTVEDSSEEHVFDEVFIVKSGNVSCPLYEASRNRGKNRELQDNNCSRKARAKKKEKEMVDLWSLLTQCSQAVAIYDQKNATELLSKIRQHSSPFGDGNERLAHYFAKGLELRLNGTPLYNPIPSLASDILKAYTLYVSACPFRRISNLFANRNIAKLAAKETTVHVIDFGISYGFQWPCLIKRLSTRNGGPPKLKITGIDFPQPGFRPAERIEATGRRLRRCCENVNVPFEFNAIAKRWESIKVEDLKIGRDEFVVVNCMYRLKNLPDDSLVLNSPRNMVLKLIKRINPDIFIHGVVNGNYNVPFFVTRFREALFHFSALFDIMEANAAREDPDRLVLEREIFGKDAMNVIAYEGVERVDRPETYKQWQFRNKKVGFKQLPLDQKIVKRARATVKSDYHKDFDIEVDGEWMLQGWKGRVIHAVSCWKPVQE